MTKGASDRLSVKGKSTPLERACQRLFLSIGSVPRPSGPSFAGLPFCSARTTPSCVRSRGVKTQQRKIAPEKRR